MANLKAVRKAVESKFLSLISSKAGFVLVLVGAVFLLVSTLQLLNSILLLTGINVVNPLHSSCATSSCSRFSDNLAGVSYEEQLASPTIDAVYTWVNGSDLRFLEELAHYKSMQTDKPIDHKFLEETNQTAPPLGSANRYADNEELRYSLRSLWRFAPWIRNVYIVTNGQIPYWLNLEHPRIKVVPHSDIFLNKSHLPVFSSPSIESHLHRIPGLSDKFLYLNDDTMFGNDIHPEDFYTHSFGHKVYLSWGVPTCSDGCPDNWLGDGFCDLQCNTTACEYDGTDCTNVSTRTKSRYNSWDSGSGNDYSGSYGSSTGSSRYCASGCPTNWVGDKMCDRSCNNELCGYDGADCGVDQLRQELYRVELTPDIANVTLPANVSSFYFDLSLVFPTVMPKAVSDEDANKHEDANKYEDANQHQVGGDSGINEAMGKAMLAQLGIDEDVAARTINPAHDPMDYMSEDALRDVVSQLLNRQGVGAGMNMDLSETEFGKVMVAMSNEQRLAVLGELEKIVLDDGKIPARLQKSRSETKSVYDEVGDGDGEDASGGVGEGDGEVKDDEGDGGEPREKPAVDGKSDEVATAASEGEAGPVVVQLSASSSSSDGGINNKYGKKKKRGRARSGPYNSFPKSRDRKKSKSYNSYSGSGYGSGGGGEDPYAFHGDMDTLVEVVAPAAMVTNAYHDNPSFVRTASVNLQHQILTVVLFRADKVVNDQIAEFELTGVLENSTEVTFTFNVSREVEAVAEGEDGAEGGGRELKLRSRARSSSSGVAGDSVGGFSGGVVGRGSDGGKYEEKESSVSKSWLSSLLTGDAPEVRVDGVPSSEDDDGEMVIGQDQMSEEDLELARWVENSKEKQLAQFQKEDRERIAKEIAKKRNANSGIFGFVWPWQVEDEVDKLLLEESLAVPVSETFPPKSTEAGNDGETNDADNAGEAVGEDEQKDGEGEEEGVDGEGGEDDTISVTKVTRAGEWEYSYPTPTPEPPPKPLDFFGQSLRHVNQLFNKHFGPESRRVPAHMPHLLSVSIQNELQSIWPEYFDATSSHRFRHGRDMQLAFSYFYYIMNSKHEFDIDWYFENVLDWDGDGMLNELELRVMLARITQAEYSWSNDEMERREEMADELWNVTRLLNEQFDHPMNISVDSIFNVDTIMDKLEALFVASPQARLYKHEMMELDEVEFYMVGNNLTNVRKRLDDMRAKGPKFICLNDDMDKTGEAHGAILDTLKTFYLTLLPEPCPFELPPGERNPYLYLDLYEAYKAANAPSGTAGTILRWGMFLTIPLVAFYMYARRVHPNVQRLFVNRRIKRRHKHQKLVMV